MPNKEPTKEWPAWKTDLDNELQLLVARVQSETELSAQIEHGRDFTERIAEDFEKVLKAREAELIEKLEEKIANLPHGAYSRITLREVIALIKG